MNRQQFVITTLMLCTLFAAATSRADDSSLGGHADRGAGESSVIERWSDRALARMDGVEFLRRVKLMYPDAVRVMLSGVGDFETATAAINEGEVHKFFVKGRDEELLRSEIRKTYWRDRTAPVGLVAVHDGPKYPHSG